MLSSSIGIVGDKGQRAAYSSLSLLSHPDERELLSVKSSMPAKAQEQAM